METIYYINEKEFLKMTDTMHNYISIKKTHIRSGVSEYSLRLMLKSDNPPPHIKINKKVLINYPRFLEWLDEQSRKAQ